MIRNDELVNELQAIRAEDPQGLLRPEAVVEAAASPASRLHGCFEWDDSKAAHQHRLTQARRLIRVAVETLPGSNEEYNVFVNLTSDRKEGSGGYRATMEVLESEQLTACMLADALKELRTFEAKYSKLQALIPVFEGYRAVLAAEADDPPPSGRGRRRQSGRTSKASKKAKKAKKKAGKKKASRR